MSDTAYFTPSGDREADRLEKVLVRHPELTPVIHNLDTRAEAAYAVSRARAATLEEARLKRQAEQQTLHDMETHANRQSLRAGGNKLQKPVGDSVQVEDKGVGPEPILEGQRQRVKSAQQLYDTLHKECDELSEAWNSAANLRDACVRYLSQVDEIVLRALPTPKKSPDIETLRTQIAGVAAKMDKLRYAPRPREEVAASIRAEVTRLAEEGAPSADKHGRVNWPLARVPGVEAGTRGIIPHVPNGIAMLAFLMPDVLAERIIETIPDNENAMTAAEAKAMLGELSKELFEAECMEEALVRQSEAEGRNIERRSKADPRAVLGLSLSCPEYTP